MNSQKFAFAALEQALAYAIDEAKKAREAGDDARLIACVDLAANIKSHAEIFELPPFEQKELNTIDPYSLMQRKAA